MLNGKLRSGPRHGGSEVAGSLGSLTGLVGFVVGVPLLLVGERAGSPLAPLARICTHPSSVLHSFGRPVTNSTVLHAMVLMAWLAWVWLVVCLLAEAVGRLRGRPPTRLPVSRHMQALVGVLVGATMALLPASKGSPPVRVAVEAVMPGVHGSMTLIGEPRPTWVVASDEVRQATAETLPTFVGHSIHPDQQEGPSGRPYTVKPGDTLWSIAAEELGSALRWREIATLNIGHRQADGEIMANAGWILPGWILELPPYSARASQNPSDESGPLGNVHATAALSDLRAFSAPHATATTLASDSLGVPSQGHVDQSPTTRDDGKKEEASGKAKTRVGMTSATPEASEDTRSKAETTTARQEAKQSTSSNHGQEPVNVPIAPFGYGLLGAGAVMVINRLRRRQQRHRPTGRRIVLPDTDLAHAEQLIRSSADPTSAAWMDATLRTLAASCRQEGRRAPRVVAVRLLDQAIELVLDPEFDSGPVVAPFEKHDDRSSWVLARRQEVLDDARTDPWIAGMDVISPALVTLGQGRQGLLLIDVEQAGSVEILGDDADDSLRAMAIELAMSSWSEQVNVVLVGFESDPHWRSMDIPTLDVLDRVRTVSDLVEVLPEFRHLTVERSVMLDAVGLARTSDARLAFSGDGWDLTVAFCSSRTTTSSQRAMNELLELAGNGSRGLATVCAGSLEGVKWHVETGNGPMSFQLAGVTESVVWPQTVNDEAGSQIAKLVEVANHLEGVESTTPRYDTYEERSLTASLGDFDDSEVSPAIEILVLGPVEVVGAARPFTRAWSLELVVYLAMHPGGASSDQWATHLWPSRSMAQASLHSTASAARRALGSTATGEDHLPRSHGRLALGPGVSTDWDKFCRLSASVDPTAWQRALALIRGRPFEGLRSTDWAVFSHVQANIESLVVDVAARSAEHCMSEGDPVRAEWAARQGLLVSAYDERLYRVLMRAADLAGNPAGVEATMTELLQLVGGEVEPYDSVHPETYELYRSLSRRQVSTRQR